MPERRGPHPLPFTEDEDEYISLDETRHKPEKGTSLPVLKRRLCQVTCKVGQTAKFECQFSGKPDVTVSWYKDSARMENGDGITIHEKAKGVHELEIENINSEDRGLYEVRGENVNGSVACAAELIVTLQDDDTASSPAPVYSQEMDSCVVDEGKLARFDCQVIAWPHPEIVWMKDSKVLKASDRVQVLTEDERVQSLVIVGVEKSDAGRYVCWARNKYGETFTEAYLNVIPKSEADKKLERHAPTFTKYFRDLVTIEGQPSEFRFKFDSKPDATIQFFINKKDVPASRFELTREADDVWLFRLKDTGLKDMGTVTCRLTNPVGFDTCSAELTVIEDFSKPRLLPEIAPKFITRFTDVDVNVGFEARFKCKVIGEPQPTVVWYKDGVPLMRDADARYKIEDYGDIFILILEDCDDSDVGEFVCKADNPAGSEECRARLDVTKTDIPMKKGRDGQMKPEFGYAPVFTKLIQDDDTKQRGTAKFSCRAYAMPEPDVQWLKDGVPIPNEDTRFKKDIDDENNYTLSLTDAKVTDAGSYTCQLRNFAGRAACTASLGVTPDPVTSLMRPRPVSELGQPLVITPYKPQRDVSPHSPMKPTTFEPSWDELDSMPVTVPSPPEMSSQKPYLFQKQPTSVRLSWLPARNPPTYTGSSPLTYIIEKRELPSAAWSPAARDIHENTYIVYGLKPEREYMFRVRARNGDGVSDPSGSELLAIRKVFKPMENIPMLIPMAEPRFDILTKPESGIPILPSDKPTFLDIRENTTRLNWLPAHIPAPTMDYSPVLYDIEMSDDQNRSWRVVAPDIQGTSFFLQDLDPNKQYSYRILAHNKHGESVPTNMATLDRYLKETPRIPIHKPLVSDIGRDALRLSWPAPNVASSYPPLTYHIEAQELPRLDWKTFATSGPETSYRISDLIPDQDYRFRVRPESEFGFGEPTESMYLPRAETYPGVPITRPTLTDIEPYAARLQWTTVEVPDHEGLSEPLRFIIEVQDDPSRNWRTLADDIYDTQYHVTDIEPMRDYHYRVRGHLGDALSDPSPPTSMYRSLAKTRRPVRDLYLTDVDEETVRVNWNRVEVPPYGLDEEPLLYMLEYQEEPDTEWRPLVRGVPTTSYRLTGLEPHGDYAFRVRAESEYGISPPSVPAPFYRHTPRVPMYVFEPPRLEHIATETPRLSWQPAVLPPTRLSRTRSVSPPRYTVQYRELGQPEWRPLATGLQDTTYPLRGLHPRHEYDFQVALESTPDYIVPHRARVTPYTTLSRLPVPPSLARYEPTISDLSSPDSFLLSWQPPSIRPHTPLSDLTHYRVEYLGEPELGWRTLAPRVVGTSYRVTDLDPGLEYLFRVKPLIDDHVGAATQPVVLYRKPVPRLPKLEPIISDVYPDSIRLTWKAVEPPENMTDITRIRYVVESQAPSGGPWVPAVTDVVDVSCRIPNLIPTRDYLFRVRAVAPSAESEPTLPAYLPRRSVQPHLPDREPYLSDITPVSVKITWSPIRTPPLGSHPGAATYVVEMLEAPSAIWRPILRNIPATSTVVTGLQPDGEYGFRVRAQNASGLSEPTRSVTLPKRAALPKMPRTEPLISDARPGSLTLSWRPAEIPSQIRDIIPVTYDVEVRESPALEWTPMFRRIPSTSFHVVGLLPGSDYELRVRPRTQYGQGEPSLPVFHRKRPATQHGFSPELSDIDTDSISLRWKIPSQFVDRKPRFNVESREWPLGDWSTLAEDIEDPWYRVNKLTPSKDYLFRVRPKDDVSYEPLDVVSFFRRRYTPRVAVTRPDIYDIDDDSLRLSWQPLRFRRSRQDEPDTYITPQRFTVEMKEPPARVWRQLASHLPDMSYQVTGLKPRHDYEFRVRPELGMDMMEPSQSIPLYRRLALPPSRVSRPIIEAEDDDSVRLRWKRVYIPAFDQGDDDLTFMVEMQQLPASGWEVMTRGLLSYTYVVRGLHPWNDYKFRVRGESRDFGMMAPSLPVSLYRSPLVPGVPIADPVIDEVEPTSVRLRWQTVYVPPYRRDEPIRFNVEGRASSDREWRSLARDIPETEFRITDLEPKRDYFFRLRAVSAEREISRPTPVIPVYRGFHEGTPIFEDFSLPLRPYIEMLTVKVPPNLPGDRPILSDITSTSASISWRPAKVPAGCSPPRYHVEQRRVPYLDWSRVADSLPVTKFHITDLAGHHGYMFRVKAENDYGYSRATLPVTLTRHGDRRRSQEPEFHMEPMAPTPAVKPRLPMDAPRIQQQTTPPTLLITWLPARIPAYGRLAPIHYVLDVKKPPAKNWQTMADYIQEPLYHVPDYNPDLEYHFRVRARSGEAESDPTLPVSVFPSRVSVEKKKDKKDEDIMMPLVSPMVKGTLPRPPIGRPIVTNVQPDSLTLTWTPGRVPVYLNEHPITFTVEMRQRPSPQWLPLADGISGSTFNVQNLNPERDYHFRVKAVNEYGESDPSLPVSVERDPQGDWVSGTPLQSSLSCTPRSTPQRGMSVDSDYEYLLHTPKDGKAIPPSLTTPSPVQYGSLGRTAHIRLNLRAFPAPILFWFHDDEKIEYGDRVNSYATPKGELSLEIGHMTMDDVGEYKCYAENDEGDASMVVKLQMADPPVFLEPFFDTIIPPRGDCQLRCRIDGIPAPSVRWYKDGRPLNATSRIAFGQPDPGVYTLDVRGGSAADCGVYSCIADNVAGKAVCEASVTIDGRFSSVSSESDLAPDDYLPEMYFKDTNINRYYYVLEEIGRGRSGVVHRAIEKSTGRPYAAKFMSLRHPKDRETCKHEFDSLKMFNRKNGANLHDAYESERQIALVTDFINGPDLLAKIADDSEWSEHKAAKVVSQLLEVLSDLHDNLIVMADLKPTDVMFDKDSDLVKLVDFGCSRRLFASRPVTSKYGSSEFSAPELLSGGALSPAMDCWSLGVLTYILLSGVSPFCVEGDDPNTTGERVMKGQWRFDDKFNNVSPEAKDFIGQLLVSDPSQRKTVPQYLSHPWLQEATNEPIIKPNTSRLQSRLLSQINSSKPLGPYKCIVNREPDSKRSLKPVQERETGLSLYPESLSFGQYLDEELWADWHTRNLTRQESQASDLNLSRESEWLNSSSGERDNMRTAERAPPLSRSSTIDESDGSLLFLRPLRDLYFTPGDPIHLTCTVLSETSPSVSWYRNNEVLGDTSRLHTSLTDDGTATLTIEESRRNDLGTYSCVARNKAGRVTSLAYVDVGVPPSFPERPAVSMISESSALVIWDPPPMSYGPDISAYSVDYRKEGDEVWTNGTYTTNDSAVISQLSPDTQYRFRVSAINKYGTGCYSYASTIARTKPAGNPKLTVPTLLSDSVRRHQRSEPPVFPRSSAETSMTDVSTTDASTRPPILFHQLKPLDPSDYYDVKGILSSGKIADINTAIDKSTGRTYSTKAIRWDGTLRDVLEGEITLLASLRHEQLLPFVDGFLWGSELTLVYYGCIDSSVVVWLACKQSYHEDMVTGVVRQVVEGLRYLHHLGIIFLNLSPSSVIRTTDGTVKLVDFHLARKITSIEGTRVNVAGWPEFIAPEIVTGEETGLPADVWSLGAYVFLLLSGQSAFRGLTDEDSLSNVAYVRYDPRCLYPAVSKESVKFIYQTIKRLPGNRLMIESCGDHEWLQRSGIAVKTRSRNLFNTENLRVFLNDRRNSEYDSYETRFGEISPSSDTQAITAESDDVVDDPHTSVTFTLDA